MSAKKPFTDRMLKALKPAPKGTRYEIADSVVPGLIVRVTDTGRRTLMLLMRFAKGEHPTRRALGEVGAIKLLAARDLARDWREKVRRGVDPGVEIKEAAEARAVLSKITFNLVAERYLKERVLGPAAYADEQKPPEQRSGKPPLQRAGKEVARQIRKVFVAAWGKRPITEITSGDVRDLIGRKAKKHPAMARNLLAAVRSLFAWATHDDTLSKVLKLSPCVGIMPGYLIGEVSKRSHVLSANVLRLLVRNVTRLRYPYGPFYSLLLLAGLRYNEAARAHWTEFDLKRREWIIPAARMKGKNSKARPHFVPITDEIAALLESLPRFNRGQFLFSTTNGEKAIGHSSKVKRMLEARMMRTLRAVLKMRDIEMRAEIPRWTNHDIRRTVRTGLAAVPTISEETREAVMAHVKPGVRGIYNVYQYRDEKRDALEKWAARLREIAGSPLGDLSEFDADSA